MCRPVLSDFIRTSFSDAGNFQALNISRCPERRKGRIGLQTAVGRRKPAEMRVLHLGTSEFLQVLLVVDTSKTAADSLSSISDYISMLTLTRMDFLDGCGELPSIIDLLSSGCGKRAKPL